MAKDLIRISLKAYDHKLLDKSAEKIIRTAKSTGAIISGPIPQGAEEQEYIALKPRVEALLATQRRLAQSFLNDAKKKIKDIKITW